MGRSAGNLALVPHREGKVAFAVDLPFTKAAAASGDLVLSGYASTWVQDRDDEFVLPTAFDLTLPGYLAKNPILLWQHNFDTPLGQVTKAQTDAAGLEIEAYVRKPVAGEEPWKMSAYQDIKGGIVRTFSIGGWFTRDMLGGALVITEVELWEISVVSVPSNPDSIFSAAVKSINGEKRSNLSQKAIEQMQQVLGLAAVSDPELHRMSPEQRRARYDELVVLYRSAGKLAPGWDDWRTHAQAVLAQQAGQAIDPAVARATVDTIRKARGLVAATKAGRVISSANESKLRDAHTSLTDAADAIGTVLAQVASTAPADEGTIDEPASTIGQPLI